MNQRRLAVWLVSSLAASAAWVAACSSDDPAPASLDPIPRLDGGTVERRDGAASLPDAGRPDDPDAGSTADAAPSDCLGDTLADAGGLGNCPAGCEATCERFATRYRTGVAEAAHACIRALGSCAEEDVFPCIDQAIIRACPTTTAVAYCDPIVFPCDPGSVDGGPFGGGGSISPEGCIGYAHAFSPAGRDDYAACIADAVVAGDCATTGALACAVDIRR